jgi:RES domain-containing protein
VLAGAKVTLQTMLDLTDRDIRRRLEFSLKELVVEDWFAIQEQGQESWTQAIGRGAHQAGFEGLLAPSARDRPGGVNMVLISRAASSWQCARNSRRRGSAIAPPGCRVAILHVCMLAFMPLGR